MGNSGRFPQGNPAATESNNNYKLHAGSVHVFITHLTLTWITGSLTYVCGHSCACVRKGVGHTDSESAPHF